MAAAMRPKMAFTFVPASVMAPTATSAMSATSSAYSSRSWPSSCRTRPRRRIIRMFMNALLLLRRRPRGERRRRATEVPRHGRARQRDGATRDERDEGDEERVLEKVLTFLAAKDRLQTGDERQSHVCVLRARPHDAQLRCVRNATTT